MCRFYFTLLTFVHSFKGHAKCHGGMFSWQPERERERQRDRERARESERERERDANILPWSECSNVHWKTIESIIQEAIYILKILVGKKIQSLSPLIKFPIRSYIIIVSPLNCLLLWSIQKNNCEVNNNNNINNNVLFFYSVYLS